MNLYENMYRNPVHEEKRERTGFRYAKEEGRMKRTKNYKKKEGRVFIKDS